MSSVLARLERLPFSRFHRRLLLMGGLGYCFDAMDSAMIAFVLPKVMTQWSLTSSELGLLASATYIGYLVGALVAGSAGDLIGRRVIMMWALAVYCLASLASGLTLSPTSFFCWRMLAGVGVGAESVIVAPFLSEFVSSSYRGRFVGALAGFFSFGFLGAAVLGYAVVPVAEWGWRLVIMVTALPIFLLLWWRRGLPESPRWLESRGRTAEAIEVVARMEDEAGSLPLPSAEPEVMVCAATDRASGSVVYNLRALFSRQLARTTSMTCVLWLSITFSYYSFFTWMPTLLVQRGMAIPKSFAYSIAIYAAQVPGYYSAAYSNDRLGRRATIVLYLLAASLAAVGLATTTTEVQVLVASICLSFFMNGTYAGVYAYTAEVFPTRVRTTGVGVASATGRLGAISAPLLIGAIFPALGFSGVFGVTTSVLISGALVVLVFGARTRGRSLEAISGSRRVVCRD